jgi:hypothetical protein
MTTSLCHEDILIEQSINVYASGGCPYCGTIAEDFARYPIGKDWMGQSVACCEKCGEGYLVSITGYGVKMPDEEGAQWAQHDKAFFELYPQRQFHIREPWNQEAIILTRMKGMKEVHPFLNAVLVTQFAPGMRGRILCPFPDLKQADEAGDQAIANISGLSTVELFNRVKSSLQSVPQMRSMEAEKEIGLAWMNSLKFRQKRTINITSPKLTSWPVTKPKSTPQ